MPRNLLLQGERYLVLIFLYWPRFYSDCFLNVHDSEKSRGRSLSSLISSVKIKKTKVFRTLFELYHFRHFMTTKYYNYFLLKQIIALLQHHCRRCGHIFCGACSEKTVALAGNTKPVRVCDACFTEVRLT